MADGTWQDTNPADMSPNFVNPQYATPQQQSALYQMAQGLMQPVPVNNWAQGLQSLSGALLGAYEQKRANELSGRAATQAAQHLVPFGQIGMPPATAAAAQPTSVAPSAAPTGGAMPAGGQGMASADPGPLAAPAAAHILQTTGVTNPLGAAALAAGFQAESGFNPAATRPSDGRDGSSSVNIGQWNGSRARDFAQFSAQNKLDPSDPKTGLAFAAQELHTTESPALAALNAATTPEQANAAALSYFRPAGYTHQDPTKAHDWGHRLALTNGTLAQLSAADGPRIGSSGAPLNQIAQNGTGAPPVNAAQFATMMGDPNIPQETKNQMMQLWAPQKMNDALGNTHIMYQNQPIAQNAQPAFRGGTMQTIAGVPMLMSGNIAAPQVGVPNVGGSGTGQSLTQSLGPSGAIGELQEAGATTQRDIAVKNEKASAYQKQFQDNQAQFQPLQDEARNLTQLQTILENNPNLPTGHESDKLMGALSVANMVGSAIGHPLFGEEATLPQLELLKKYGLNLGASKAAAAGLPQTNLGITQSDMTSTNPEISYPANVHLTDNLVRLNAVGQNRQQFMHNYYLQNGNYDHANEAWQEKLNASPVPLSKFPVKGGENILQTDPKTGKQVEGIIVPSTASSGYSWFPKNHPLFDPSAVTKATR